MKATDELWINSKNKDCFHVFSRAVEVWLLGRYSFDQILILRTLLPVPFIREKAFVIPLFSGTEGTNCKLDFWVTINNMNTNF